jgi:hypothetical protein
MTASPLSDTLQEKVTQETYGLFPTPVTRYSIPNHDDLKQQILRWMESNDIIDDHKRNAICHNVIQVGPNNKIVNDLPDLYNTLIQAATYHNDNSLKYNAQLGISDSYLEIANKDAIYAPHEHSNCLYSIHYLINYNAKEHAYIKWRRNVSSSFYPVIQLDQKEMSPYNMTEATFNQSEGDMLVYPSNLTHGYDSNLYDQRISLTANIVPM